MGQFPTVLMLSLIPICIQTSKFFIGDIVVTWTQRHRLVQPFSRSAWSSGTVSYLLYYTIYRDSKLFASRHSSERLLVSFHTWLYIQVSGSLYGALLGSLLVYPIADFLGTSFRLYIFQAMFKSSQWFFFRLFVADFVKGGGEKLS